MRTQPIQARLMLLHLNHSAPNGGFVACVVTSIEIAISALFSQLRLVCSVRRRVYRLQQTLVNVCATSLCPLAVAAPRDNPLLRSMPRSGRPMFGPAEAIGEVHQARFSPPLRGPPLTGTETALWCHSGLSPVPIRWVLVSGPLGEHTTPFPHHCSCRTGEIVLVRVALRAGTWASRRSDSSPIQRSCRTPALLGLFCATNVWPDRSAREGGQDSATERYRLASQPRADARRRSLA